jgi:hypothetical protein
MTQRNRLLVVGIAAVGVYLLWPSSGISATSAKQVLVGLGQTGRYGPELARVDMSKVTATRVGQDWKVYIVTQDSLWQRGPDLWLLVDGVSGRVLAESEGLRHHATIVARGLRQRRSVHYTDELMVRIT